ncbi:MULTISPECIES: TerC/Alx family metal homeostasis membrane protein [Vibrio]|uniref:TerC/Alx family metal homeostasis membrane protein n=1 Tax=Vibrio TaxID=662 RepID=UPI0001542902|nr:MULTISPECIES: TerC/Alx family metal homeostasis membrane protein [Vibrio]EDL52375.1 putative transmembrane transport protein [Vibrio mediterranei AK1]KFA97903.1 membrane protein [Vibrio sp. ER1A]MCY9853739.1 TerC/Alx family metal homeostasis membrane protein [Vibrio mediterranei]MDA0107466.1 TerC/Alx family metal homeostasis membrane protein [Vibrio sp. La 4.2.2]NUW75086.1 TerC/Alx family metal homeostasis membrane protein [Vibrio mediterranei]
MSPSIYVSFFVLTLALVALDIYQTRGGQISIRKAAIWSVFWFLLAFAFSATIYLFWDFYAPASDYTAEKATVSFLTGYLLEKSLSVDNLFVFAIIFHQYAVPEHLRPRALLWGVIGALVLRAIMISVGAQLLAEFHWVMYLFAAFLIWTGIKLAKDSGEDEVNPLPERVIRKLVPVTDDFHGNKLSIIENGKRVFTPMLVVIGVIAFMDIMFALDSIPAIFAVTREPFLVLAANVFALLGLRSLYFVLEGMMNRFVYLKPALSFIMIFIGVKMALVGSAWEIPTWVSLSVILVTMTVATVASLYREKREPHMVDKNS